MQKINPSTLRLLVSVSYCCIMISGMHIGGPWITYLLFSLVFAFIYPPPPLFLFFGIAGLVLFIIKPHTLLGGAWVQRLIGLSAMWLSLIVFFTGKDADYNYPTFQETVPLISLGLFVGLSIWHFISLVKSWRKLGRTAQNT